MPLFLPRWHKPVSLLVVALILVPLTKSQPSSQVPFQPPAGVLVAGLRETATHRSSTPTLRITSDPGISCPASHGRKDFINGCPSSSPERKLL
jgi:hypothetical protein